VSFYDRVSATGKKRKRETSVRAERVRDLTFGERLSQGKGGKGSREGNGRGQSFKVYINRLIWLRGYHKADKKIVSRIGAKRLGEKEGEGVVRAPDAVGSLNPPHLLTVNRTDKKRGKKLSPTQGQLR